MEFRENHRRHSAPRPRRPGDVWGLQHRPAGDLGRLPELHVPGAGALQPLEGLWQRSDQQL